MKINGLKMVNYWKVNFVFNLILFTLVSTLYLLFGKYLSGLNFFTENSIYILIITNIGWGLCQISCAFMLAVFLNDSQTASMFGYVFAILMTLGAGTFVMCGGIYNRETMEMWPMYFPIPMFPYCRICFIMADQCTWSRCFQRWAEYPDEVFNCIKALYVDAFVYLCLALYLNQVVP